MIKKLVKHGDGLALIIDDALIELLCITEQTSLEISTDGRALVVQPVVDNERAKRFEQSLQSANDRYAKTLKRLAE